MVESASGVMKNQDSGNYLRYGAEHIRSMGMEGMRNNQGSRVQYGGREWWAGELDGKTVDCVCTKAGTEGSSKCSLV